MVKQEKICDSLRRTLKAITRDAHGFAGYLINLLGLPLQV